MARNISWVMNIKEQLDQYIKKAAKEYVIEFNEIDSDDVGEFGTDLHMYTEGANEMKELLLIAVKALNLIGNARTLDGERMASHNCAAKALAEIQEKIKGQ